ncbi:MAG: hypothetical protein ACYC46_16375, partial [Acidobacteriaceae bacterium]
MALVVRVDYAGRGRRPNLAVAAFVRRDLSSRLLLLQGRVAVGRRGSWVCAVVVRAKSPGKLSGDVLLGGVSGGERRRSVQRTDQESGGDGPLPPAAHDAHH